MYRNIITIVLGVFFISFTSCTSINYQVLSVKSPLMEKGSDEVTFENDKISVVYNFWSHTGDLRFFIENKTDKILYLDLNNSFFIKNGTANNYYEDRTTSYSSKVASEKRADGVSVASSSDKTVSVSNKRIVPVPPKSRREISYFDLQDDFFDFCNLKVYPSRNDTSQASFNRQNSPLTFENFMTYSFSEDMEESQTFRNEFWVENIKTMKSNNFFVKTDKPEPCNPKESERVTVVPEKAPNKFFIEYKDPY